MSDFRENAKMNAAVGARSRMDAVFCDSGSRDVMWTKTEDGRAMIEVRPQEYNIEVPIRT